MRHIRIVLAIGLAVIAATTLSASGPLGIYGVIEKVVFEPSESGPERIQVWGAFAYVDGGPLRDLSASPVSRGYLYFSLPSAATAVVTPAQRDNGLRSAAPVVIQNARREWSDLKAVEGTGQAVGFGSWFYTGGFGTLRPETRTTLRTDPPSIAGPQTDVRVRPSSETPSSPTPYETNAGVVKLSDTGNRADLVRQLREVLR